MTIKEEKANKNTPTQLTNSQYTVFSRKMINNELGFTMEIRCRN